ncbi:MAG: GPO family capsid scaffolding protein, partial [Parvibaculaceae bacterium]|nr:GPO family capsid scaffolding protein [Parvibaculaceae bacterium]
MSKLISKFVTIARAGKTIDGREISADQIDQMAADYNPKTYGARIWNEHIRGVLPEGDFSALGDVLSLKAENDKDGNRLLKAQLAPTDKLMKINKDRQKVFTSIEMAPDFAGSGKAYLVGLAVTDTPASLGTEMLTFCRQNSDSLSDTLKDKLSDNTFSDAFESPPFEFAEAPETPASHEPTLFNKVKEMLSRTSKSADARFSDMNASILEMATAVESLQEQMQALAATPSPDTNAGTDTKTELTTLKAQLEKLTTSLSTSPDPTQPS